MTHICTGAEIQYENGAVVKTSFLTNLDGRYEVRSCPDLKKAVEDANKQNLQKMKAPPMPKYRYPDNVLTASMVNYYSNNDTVYNLPFGESVFVRRLDKQKPFGKQIYGAGLLLTEKAAAEKAAAEKAAAKKAAAEKAAATVWELSEREKRIIEQITKGR